MSGDLLWANVAFLSGFEGTPGDDDYTDESSNGHVISGPAGVVPADDTVKKFGTTSAEFTTTNGYLQAPNDSSFDLAGNDFTVETWIYLGTGNTFFRAICGVWTDLTQRGWRFGVTGGNTLEFGYSTTGSDSLTISHAMPSVTTATWYHVAVARQGNAIRFYFNGQYIGQNTVSATFNFPSIPFTIGDVGSSGGSIASHMDELRVTNGAARYTSETTYTAPSDPFPRGPAIPNTISGSEATTVTLSCFMKMELPERSILLSDGGQIEYNSEIYTSHDDEFGALNQVGAIETGFGDLAEDGELLFAVLGDVAESVWWRDDLFDARVRIWLGEVDSDDYTVTTATLLADLLVDTYDRRQGPSGQDILAFQLMGRAERLFLTNQGNVCSQRFHQSIWAGEKGFNNCTDLVGYTAWGAASPTRDSSGSGGTSTGLTFQLN